MQTPLEQAREHLQKALHSMCEEVVDSDFGNVVSEEVAIEAILAALAATTGRPAELSVLESDAPTTELLGQLMRSVLAGRGFEFKGDDYALVDSENSRAVSARYEVMDIYGDIVRYLRKTAASSVAATTGEAAGPVDALTDLVNRFSAALLAKLQAARVKYGYESDGFLATDWQQDCLHGLLCHIEKGDPRDVAAYCAFMWHHGWSTTPTPVPQVEEAKAALNMYDSLRHEAMIPPNNMAEHLRTMFQSPEYAARIAQVQADAESLKSKNPNRRDWPTAPVTPTTHD